MSENIPDFLTVIGMEPEATEVAAATPDTGATAVLSSPTDATATLPGMPPEGRDAALLNPRDDIAQLDELERHLYAHRYARLGIESYSATIDPEAAAADSAEALAILAQEDQELLCSPTTGALLERLGAPQAQALLDDTHKAQVRILGRDRAQLVDVPADEQADFSRLTSEAQNVWRRAKAAND